jgi:CRP-like cAMP-binding protein
MRCLLVNLTDGVSFPFSISVNDVANVLDVSPNEVSGSMAALATSLLISFGDEKITILDFAKLQAVGHFDPGYLSRLSP